MFHHIEVLVMCRFAVAMLLFPMDMDLTALSSSRLLIIVTTFSPSQVCTWSGGDVFGRNPRSGHVQAYVSPCLKKSFADVHQSHLAVFESSMSLFFLFCMRAKTARAFFFFEGERYLWNS